MPGRPVASEATGEGYPMEIMYAGVFLVLALVLLLGLFEMLGETKLTWIFPVISVVALTAFLVRCMFAAPAPH
jgi:hypothetical protein